MDFIDNQLAAENKRFSEACLAHQSTPASTECQFCSSVIM